VLTCFQSIDVLLVAGSRERCTLIHPRYDLSRVKRDSRMCLDLQILGPAPQRKTNKQRIPSSQVGYNLRTYFSTILLKAVKIILLSSLELRRLRVMNQSWVASLFIWCYRRGVFLDNKTGSTSSLDTIEWREIKGPIEKKNRALLMPAAAKMVTAVSLCTRKCMWMAPCRSESVTCSQDHDDCTRLGIALLLSSIASPGDGIEKEVRGLMPPQAIETPWDQGV